MFDSISSKLKGEEDIVSATITPQRRNAGKCATDVNMCRWEIVPDVFFIVPHVFFVIQREVPFSVNPISVITTEN